MKNKCFVKYFFYILLSFSLLSLVGLFSSEPETKSVFFNARVTGGVITGMSEAGPTGGEIDLPMRNPSDVDEILPKDSLDEIDEMTIESVVDEVDNDDTLKEEIERTFLLPEGISKSKRDKIEEALDENTPQVPEKSENPEDIIIGERARFFTWLWFWLKSIFVNVPQERNFVSETGVKAKVSRDLSAVMDKVGANVVIVVKDGVTSFSSEESNDGENVLLVVKDYDKNVLANNDLEFILDMKNGKFNRIRANFISGVAYTVIDKNMKDKINNIALVDSDNLVAYGDLSSKNDIPILGIVRLNDDESLYVKTNKNSLNENNKAKVIIAGKHDGGELIIGDNKVKVDPGQKELIVCIVSEKESKDELLISSNMKITGGVISEISGMQIKKILYEEEKINVDFDKEHYELELLSIYGDEVVLKINGKSFTLRRNEPTDLDDGNKIILDDLFFAKKENEKSSVKIIIAKLVYYDDKDTQTCSTTILKDELNSVSIGGHLDGVDKKSVSENVKWKVDAKRTSIKCNSVRDSIKITSPSLSFTKNYCPENKLNQDGMEELDNNIYGDIFSYSKRLDSGGINDFNTWVGRFSYLTKDTARYLRLIVDEECPANCPEIRLLSNDDYYCKQGIIYGSTIYKTETLFIGCYSKDSLGGSTVTDEELKENKLNLKSIKQVLTTPSGTGKKSSEKKPVTQCIPGTYKVDNELCCPEGTEFNSQTKKCDCPNKYYWNEYTQTCSSNVISDYDNECPSGYKLQSDGNCVLLQVTSSSPKCRSDEYLASFNKCCPMGTVLSDNNCVCQKGIWDQNQKKCIYQEQSSSGSVIIPGGPTQSTPQQCPSGQVRDPNTGECRRTEPAPQPQINCQEFASYNQGTNLGNKASIYECRDTAKASMSLQSSGLCGREVQPQLFAYFDTNSGCCSGVWNPSYNPIQYPETFCGYYRNTDWNSVSQSQVIIHTRTWFAKNRDESETCAEINSKKSVPLETC